MPNIQLDPHQVKAWKELKNARILRGDVGAGKSRIALSYYYTMVCGGAIKVNGNGEGLPPAHAVPLYIITTAKKRDDLEWQRELSLFGIGLDDNDGWLGQPVVIDSWNNIQKYIKVAGGFFIFDEQRLVGTGAWVRSFYKIARKNQWIILTATPGDTWSDYVPVFVAHGFYTSRADFLRRHAVYNVYATYPKIDRYVGESELRTYLDRVLVVVDYTPHTTRHVLTVPCDYDRDLMEKVQVKRWNPWEDRPIKDAGELFRLMRKVVNQDSSRLEVVKKALASHSRLIVFYNFDYELEILRGFVGGLNVPCAEWNGHKHMEIPTTPSWIYLVQYTAGSEGWNCTSTDSILFYSLTYSYKAFEQAMGRIDRMDTEFENLYYHVLRSDSMIDRSIWNSLRRKKNFNEKAVAKKNKIVFEDAPKPEAIMTP